MVLYQREGALLVPLFKRGDPNNIDNYRGISPLSLPGRFCNSAKKKLQKRAEGLLLEGQWLPKGQILQY